MEGYLAPEIYLRRGLSYTFRVEGGNDPYSPEYYHPLVITTSPDGGFDRLSPERRRRVKILSGVEYTRRGVPRTTASGRLCLWKHRPGVDRRSEEIESCCTVTYSRTPLIYFPFILFIHLSGFDCSLVLLV